MKTQSCKAKGRRLQQQVASDLLHRFPQLAYDDIRSTSMGAPGEDILLSPAARRCIPFSFEVKNHERLNVWSAIEQATANTPVGALPAVVFKKNHMSAYIALPWTCFLDMLAPPLSDAQEQSDKQVLSTLAVKLAEMAARM
jgi:hypothetical protein